MRMMIGKIDPLLKKMIKIKLKMIVCRMVLNQTIKKLKKLRLTKVSQKAKKED